MLWELKDSLKNSQNTVTRQTYLQTRTIPESKTRNRTLISVLQRSEEELGSIMDKIDFSRHNIYKLTQKISRTYSRILENDIYHYVIRARDEETREDTLSLLGNHTCKRLEKLITGAEQTINTIEEEIFTRLKRCSLNLASCENLTERYQIKRLCLLYGYLSSAVKPQKGVDLLGRIGSRKDAVKQCFEFNKTMISLRERYDSLKKEFIEKGASGQDIRYIHEPLKEILSEISNIPECVSFELSGAMDPTILKQEISRLYSQTEMLTDKTIFESAKKEQINIERNIKYQKKMLFEIQRLPQNTNWDTFIRLSSKEEQIMSLRETGSEFQFITRRAGISNRLTSKIISKISKRKNGLCEALLHEAEETYLDAQTHAHTASALSSLEYLQEIHAKHMLVAGTNEDIAAFEENLITRIKNPTTYRKDMRHNSQKSN